MSRVYISGPITGAGFIEDRARFSDAQEYIEGRGDIAVNPIFLCTSDYDSSMSMRRRIKALMDCDSIRMLKGWKTSKSARLEHFIALKLNIKITIEK